MSNDPSGFSWDAGETIGPAPRPAQPTPPPPRPTPERPAPQYGPDDFDDEPPRARRGIPTVAKVILGVVGGGVLLMVLICAGIYNYFTSVGASPQARQFLFNAEDDSIVDAAETRAAAAGLRGLGKDVTLEIVPTGDHYDAMIDEGIPRAIQWLRTRGALR